MGKTLEALGKTLEAVFDGKVLRPDEPINLEPNTRVRITIESSKTHHAESSEEERLHSIPERVRTMRIAGRLAISLELGLAIFGLLSLFLSLGLSFALALALALALASALTAALTYVVYIGIKKLVHRRDNSAASLTRVKHWFVLPAFVLLLVSTFSVVVLRFATQPLTAIESYVSAAMYLTIIGFVVLGAALLVSAEMLNWSRRSAEKPKSFLRTARTLNLQGPPDWAARLDDYLYGDETPEP